MPIIEFRCESCGCRFEELIRSGAADGVVCPSCSGEDLERLYSVFGVQVAPGGAPSRAADEGGFCAPGGCCSCR